MVLALASSCGVRAADVLIAALNLTQLGCVAEEEIPMGRSTLTRSRPVLVRLSGLIANRKHY